MRTTLLVVTMAVTAPAPTARAQTIPTWRLSNEPVLRLEDDGSPEREFTRIVGAFLVGSGRIAVAENAASEVRIFERDGRWVRNVGRQGSGPGEFQFLRYAFRTGDTLFTFDPMLKRVTAVLTDGAPRVAFGQSVNARGGRPFDVQGRTADGRWVAHYDEMPGWDAPAGVSRGRAGVGLVNADGEGNVRWLAELPGMATFVHNPTGNIRQASTGPIAFTPYVFVTGSGPYAWFGESGAATLVRFDVRSNARRPVTLPIEARAPTRELVAASRADDDAMDPQGNQGFRNAKFGEHLPRTLPFFEALLPTGDGGVWVQAYTGARSAAAIYLALNPEGQPVAWVMVPQGFRITDVRGNRVIGLHRDDDGLDEVRVYELMQR